MANLRAHIITGVTEESREFLKNIRGYNSAIALASFRAPGLSEELANAQHGVYTFRIQGGVYHMVGDLEPGEGEVPSFAQIYFMDDAQQAATRNHHFHGALAPEILAELQALMGEYNPFLGQFKYALEILRETPGSVAVQLTIHPDKVPDGAHARVYNAPSVSEVAAVIPNYDMVKRPCDIVLHRRDGGVQIISHTHPGYDSLHYMVFHMAGGFGWHVNIAQVGATVDPEAEEEPDEEGEEEPWAQTRKETRNVTISKFYAYRLMVRNGVYNVLHLGRRLFQQYIVDQFVKKETSDMNFFRFNQDKLRASTYRVVQQLADTHGNVGDVGKHIILPSSYIGSPRHVHQLYSDAMAIVREHGKPSLFITMTCNPGMDCAHMHAYSSLRMLQLIVLFTLSIADSISFCTAEWPEIQEALLPGQSADDRPDIVARVFSLKLKELMADLTKRQIFGRAVAMVCIAPFRLMLRFRT